MPAISIGATASAWRCGPARRTSNAVRLIQKRDGADHWQGYEVLIDDPTYSTDGPNPNGQRDRISHFIVRLAVPLARRRH